MGRGEGGVGERWRLAQGRGHPVGDALRYTKA